MRRFLAHGAAGRHDHGIELVSADRVLVASSVLADSRCRARLEAMLPSVESRTIEILDDDRVERALIELGPRSGRPRSGLVGRGRSKDLVAFARLPPNGEVFPGYSWRELRDGREQSVKHGVLCQTAIEIQSVVGCTYDCTYCPYASFVCVRLDIENFVDRVAKLVSARPSQTLWKLNNRSDTLGLEPEYGLAGQLIERFAALGGPTLMLYSKGDEVKHLADLDHRGKTVASFTLSPRPVAELLEPGAPPLRARIDALRTMQRAGYPTRVRLSPIVPIVDWRKSYDDLLARVARAGAPELVTLWTLSMTDFEELPRVVPFEELDPELLAEARRAAPRMHGEKGAPFPPRARARIYRELIEIVRAHLPKTRVSLCLESEQVWKSLTPMLPERVRSSFVCNCGPRSTPEAVRGLPLLRERLL